ncbi:MAG TPA: trypsin-like peptidase domain-containing protein [Streptosporangiaceae bacterium]
MTRSRRVTVRDIAMVAAALPVLLAGAACSGSGPAHPAATTSSSHESPHGSPGTGAGDGAQAAGLGGAASLQSAFVSVVRTVLPSVVEIKTASGLGSGVIFDNAGHIVTNAHVVGDATTFDVVLSGSVTPLRARLTGSYPPDDLAVIKLTGSHKLVPARFADSSKLEVGDVVLAMGNPLGLASSVTDGIVSATGRTVSEPQGSGSPGATLPDAIQTSAPINPGNSGGALVDLAARVVGIPTLAASDPQLGGAAAGIGFAIPSNIVTDIARQIIKFGRVTNSHRAALGVQVRTVAGPDGQPAGAGIVSVLPGGGAAQAGLRPGEVIVAVNRTATPDTETLAAILAGLRPGQRVPVTVVRQGGGKVTVNVTLGQLPGG